MNKKAAPIVRIVFLLSILLNIILIVFVVVNDSKISELTQKYEETSKNYEDLTKKYNDLEKKHNELNDKYKKALKAKQKTVYLTFDDGPSANTNKIIDILKEYDVKGTFFVIGNGSDADYKKIVDSGNTIALHSNKHDYAMYNDPQKFIKDLEAIHNRVKKATGLDIKEFRFAGGSSNSYVSKSTFNSILKYLNKNGYRYHDWNCDSTDASGVSVPKSTLVNSANSCGGNTINILMHDAPAKTTTVDALPGIIQHYKKLGYNFDVIDKDALTVQHIPQNG